MDTGGITFYFSAVTADLVSGVQSVVEAVRSVGDSASSVSELSTSFQEVGTSASETAGMVDELSSSLSSVSEATGPIEEVSTSISNLDDSLSSISTSASEAAASAEESMSEVADSADSAAGQVASAGSKGGGGFMAGMSKVGGSLFAVQAGVNMVKGAFQQATGPFGDFQEQMTQLVTGAGESQKNLSMVGAGIKNMSVQTGESTDELSAGMYMIESAGQHGAQGLETLKDAAEGAKVGAASLADVANGVTTAMTDYSSSGLTAAQATNTLIATVASGKTHMSDLSNAMATILPTASAVKVKFVDVMGAMATMTAEGVPAADAATYLRQTLMSLENPASKSVSVLKSVGLTSGEVATEMQKSLPGALEMITEHLKTKFPEGSQAYNKALAEIAGGTKQMQGLLDLTGQHLGTFEGNVKGITDSVKKGGSSITGWAEVQQDFNQKMAVAAAGVNVFWINLGEKLAPVILQLMTDMQNVATAIGQFVNWMNQGSVGATAIKAILAGLGIGILAFAVTFIPALVAGFIAWAIAAGAAAIATLAAAAPFILIGAIAALVIFGIIEAVQHWGAISAWLKQAWAATINWLGGALNSIGEFFVMIWNKIKQATNTAWEFLKNIVKAGAMFLLAIILGPFLAIGALFVWLYNHNIYFKQLIDTVIGIVKAGLSWLQNAFHTALQWIIDKIMWFVNLNEQEFNMIYSTIKTVLEKVYGFVRGIVTTILNFFSSQWNQAVNLVTQLWQKISSIFSSAWSRFVQSPLGQLLSNIVNFFQQLPGKALTWGENLIKGFINGILNMLGGVGSAVGQIAGKVAGFLGFHSPAKEGPGSELDTWAPNMVREFAEGLEAGTPLIEAAVTHLIQPTTALGSYPGDSNTPNAPLQGSGSNGRQETHVHVYLDGQDVGNLLTHHVATNIINQSRAAGPVTRAA